jgi:hypothetical protein
MKDFLLPLISARIVYLEVLLNFRKSGKEDSRNFRLGTRSGLICVDIIQGSEAFCLFLCAEKGPPGIILHINSRILLYYYSHPNIW